MINHYVYDVDSFEELKNSMLKDNGFFYVILFCSGKHCPPCNNTKAALNIGKENDFFQKMIKKSGKINIIFYYIDLQDPNYSNNVPKDLYDIVSKVRSIPNFFGLKIDLNNLVSVITEHRGFMDQDNAEKFFNLLIK
jgi:hypothetical protein